MAGDLVDEPVDDRAAALPAGPCLLLHRPELLLAGDVRRVEHDHVELTGDRVEQVGLDRVRVVAVLLQRVPGRVERVRVDVDEGDVRAVPGGGEREDAGAGAHVAHRPPVHVQPGDDLTEQRGVLPRLVHAIRDRDVLH